MAGVAGFRRRILGHEGNGLALLLRHFLDALLKQHVHVRHRKRLIVDEIDFVLSPAPFAFAALNGHAGLSHGVADEAHEWLVARGLHEMIIDPVIAGRLQIPITARKGRMIRLIEEIKFEFTGAIARQPIFAQQLQLTPENRARILCHERSVIANVVAEHERCSGLPWKQADGVQIGFNNKITKARIPVCDFEPVERIHFDINGEEIVAAMRAMFQNRLKEWLGAETFAHEAAEGIGESDNDRVNRARADLRLELNEVHGVWNYGDLTG